MVSQKLHAIANLISTSFQEKVSCVSMVLGLLHPWLSPWLMAIISQTHSTVELSGGCKSTELMWGWLWALWGHVLGYRIYK